MNKSRICPTYNQEIMSFIFWKPHENISFETYLKNISIKHIVTCCALIQNINQNINRIIKAMANSTKLGFLVFFNHLLSQKSWQLGTRPALCGLVCIPECLIVWLSDCLIVWLSDCLIVCLCDCLFVWLKVCLIVSSNLVAQVT